MTPSDERSISVLLVVSDQEQQDALRQMLSHSNWRVTCAGGFDEAVATMQRERVGVVVSSYVVRGGFCWRDLLAASRNLECPPAVVVTDSRLDERTFSEVLRSGGYDIIPQPFERREAFFIVSAAWRYWRAHDRRANAAGFAA